MGKKTSKVINMHHSQVDKAKTKKNIKADQRLYSFQINRANIKIEVEASRQYLLACTLVFIMGLLLIVFGLAYIIGASLYG